MDGLYQWVVLVARHRRVHVRARARRVGGRRAEVAQRTRAPARAGAARSVAGRDRRHVRLDRLLLIAGIAAAFIAGLWGKGWIWAAIVLLVLMFAAIYARATTWFSDLRRAAGQGYYVMRKGAQPAERPDAAKFAALTASSRPMEIAAISYGGLVLILWLMVMKPF
jgi:hypothetical protein